MNFLHNPLSTAGTHRRYPTKIIQHTHTALLSPSSFARLLFVHLPLQSLFIVSVEHFLYFPPSPLFLSLSLSLLDFLFFYHVPKTQTQRQQQSSYNPVSCPLNIGQVHTPRSCSATEITHTHTAHAHHGRIQARARGSRSETMRDYDRFS